jgi:hypothetical protein
VVQAHTKVRRDAGLCFEEVVAGLVQVVAAGELVGGLDVLGAGHAADAKGGRHDLGLF